MVSVALLAAGKPAKPTTPKEPDPYSSAALFSDKNVLAELKAAEKALDAQLGRITKRPRILLSSREFAFERALADARGPLKNILPNADETFIRTLAAQTAVGAFAFYEPEKHTIHLLPENFEAFARRRKDLEFLEPEFLRMVLVHELVHAWDGQENDLAGLRAKVKKPAQMKVWSAVAEGHAQYVTQRAMQSMDLLDQFERFSQTVFGGGLDQIKDPAERHLAERAAVQGRFGYVEGHAFFEALAKSNPELVRKPFQKMPESASVILHPERYWNPQARPKELELSTVVRRVVDGVEPAWKVMPLPLDEHTVRSAAAPLLDAAKVGALLENFVAGVAFGARPPPPKTRAEAETMIRTGTHRQSLVCSAMQMTDEASAKKMLGMLKRLAAVEGETLSKSEKLDVPTVKEGTLPVAGDLPNFRQVRLFDDGERVQSQISVTFVRGVIVAGCQFSASPRQDPVLTDLVDMFANELGVFDSE